MSKHCEYTLPNLSALSLDAKAEKKTKLVKKTPYLRPIQDIDEIFEKVVLSNRKEIQLSSTGKKSLTEAERSWCRENYGNNWSSEGTDDRIQTLKLQARAVMSAKLLPIVTDELEKLGTLKKVEEETRNFNAEHYESDGKTPKLDYLTDIVPWLTNTYGEDWDKWPAGDPLPIEKINGYIKLARDPESGLLKTKEAELTKQLKEKIDNLYINEEQQIMLLYDKFHFPTTLNKRKAHALLRHWFNRKGPDGRMRTWHLAPEYAKNPERMNEMKQVREAWALSEVTKETYDPANPPRPPRTYSDSKLEKLKVKNNELFFQLDMYSNTVSYHPDPVSKISPQGGQWVWRYMRALENAKFEDLAPMSPGNLIEVDTSAQYWDQSYREAQKQLLTDVYQEFIKSVDELSGIEGAKGVAYSYTVGSGKFNRYLRWPSASVGGDPSKIPDKAQGEADAVGNTFYGNVGPPDMMHRLYKLINRCPLIPSGPPVVFLRAVTGKSGLPHNLGKSPPFAEPVVGKRYLNVTFMSTSSAAPSSYLKGNLSSFYSKYNKCCMYAITATVGETPALPLVLGGNANSQFPDEQEVVLPPGLLLVFQGTKMLNVGDMSTLVYFYQVFKPPDIELPEA
tara:strand:- start:1368 stop:3230 length:1863 start_codon:yes stop_codon:yes gene_type:complete